MKKDNIPTDLVTRHCPKCNSQNLQTQEYMYYIFRCSKEDGCDYFCDDCNNWCSESDVVVVEWKRKEKIELDLFKLQMMLKQEFCLNKKNAICFCKSCNRIEDIIKYWNVSEAKK